MVSREAVNTLVDELARAISDERCCMSRGRSTATIMQDILDLPSVTPMSGKWKREEFPNFTVAWFCNKCGRGSYRKSNYCPNCGAKMENIE